MHDLAFVFAVGLVVGLTGVGAGSLMTPLLIFFFGIKPHLAIGTDLLFAAFTKLGGTASLARTRMVDWKIVGQTAAGSIPASLAAHCGRRYRPRGAAHAGGRSGSCVHRIGRLGVAGQVAGGLAARHLAGLSAGQQHARPLDTLPAFRAAGLCRRQTHRPLNRIT